MEILEHLIARHAQKHLWINVVWIVTIEYTAVSIFPLFFMQCNFYTKNFKIGYSQYECPICTTRSSRKDNIQRHLRNLHPNEDQQKIFANILQNFKDKNTAKKHNKSIEKDVCQKLNAVFVEETPTNFVYNPESVIKFAGRIPMAQIPIISEAITTNVNKTSIETNASKLKEDHKSTIKLVLEVDEPHDDDPSLNNIQIYRKLLSPYLKPPQAVLEASSKFSQDTNYNVPINSKIIENGNQKTSPSKLKLNVPVNKTTSNQLEIYRRILMPTHDDDKMVTNNEKNNSDKINVSDPSKNGQNRNEYFSEMHWRKRTSQCFNQIDQ